MSESAEEIVDACIKSVFGHYIEPNEELVEVVRKNDAQWREVAADLGKRLAEMTAERDELVAKIDAWAAEVAEVHNDNLALKAQVDEFESSHANTLSEMPAAPLASTVDVSDFGQVAE